MVAPDLLLVDTSANQGKTTPELFASHSGILKKEREDNPDKTG